MKYHIADHVYISTLGQDAILLDLTQKNKNQQYVLIKNGLQFFSEILMESESPDHEFDKGIAACVQAGWLLEKPPDTKISNIMSWPMRWLPLHLEAYRILRYVAKTIEHNTLFPFILSMMTLPVEPSKDDSRLPLITHAVSEASHLFRHPMTCLHQSLAICWMLRFRRIAAQVEIRVQQDPLLFHMIVVDGKKILSWKPGLTSITTLDHFLKATTPLFHSGELDVHLRREEK